MSQLFGPYYTTACRVGLAMTGLALVTLPFLCYFYYRTPYITLQHYALEQPVPFSHQHHVAGLGLDCRYCHSTVEHSAYAGLPATQVCMTCHSQIWKDAAMLAPVRDSYATGKPLAWQRIHALPEFVFFDHGIHVHAGVSCYACHGRVDTMPLMEKAQPLTMQWCTGCHANPAPHLVPPDQEFAMPPAPPTDPQLGQRLMRQHGIDTRQIINCSTCHR